MLETAWVILAAASVISTAVTAYALWRILPLLKELREAAGHLSSITRDVRAGFDRVKETGRKVDRAIRTATAALNGWWPGGKEREEEKVESDGV